MEPWLTELNGYSNLITAFATAVLAALTALLWFENRGLRQAGSAPAVVSYIRPHADGSGAIEFVVANVGKGPAFNVTFEFECDESDFEAHRVSLKNDIDRTAMSVIPQDVSISSLFGIGFELYGNLGNTQIAPLRPFSVIIKFQDIIGRTHSSTKQIDIRQFAGLRGILSKSNPAKIAAELEKIENHLAKIAKNSAPISNLLDETGIGDSHRRKRKG